MHHSISAVSPDFDLVFPRSSIDSFVLLRRPVTNLYELTVVLWVRSWDVYNYGTILSYAVEDSWMSEDKSNILTLYDCASLQVRFPLIFCLLIVICLWCFSSCSVVLFLHFCCIFTSSCFQPTGSLWISIIFLVHLIASLYLCSHLDSTFIPVAFWQTIFSWFTALSFNPTMGGTVVVCRTDGLSNPAPQNSSY